VVFEEGDAGSNVPVGRLLRITQAGTISELHFFNSEDSLWTKPAGTRFGPLYHDLVLALKLIPGTQDVMLFVVMRGLFRVTLDGVITALGSPAPTLFSRTRDINWSHVLYYAYNPSFDPTEADIAYFSAGVRAVGRFPYRFNITSGEVTKIDISNDYRFTSAPDSQGTRIGQGYTRSGRVNIRTISSIQADGTRTVFEPAESDIGSMALSLSPSARLYLAYEQELYVLE